MVGAKARSYQFRRGRLDELIRIVFGDNTDDAAAVLLPRGNEAGRRRTLQNWRKTQRIERGRAHSVVGILETILKINRRGRPIFRHLGIEEPSWEAIWDWLIASPLARRRDAVQGLLRQLIAARQPRDCLQIIQQIADSDDPGRGEVLRLIARGTGNFAMVEQWAAEEALEGIGTGLRRPADLSERAMARIPKLPETPRPSVAVLALKALNTALYTHREPGRSEALAAIAAAMGSNPDSTQGAAHHAARPTESATRRGYSRERLLRPRKTRKAR